MLQEDHKSIILKGDIIVSVKAMNEYVIIKVYHYLLQKSGMKGIFMNSQKTIGLKRKQNTIRIFFHFAPRISNLYAVSVMVRF